MEEPCPAGPHPGVLSLPATQPNAEKLEVRGQPTPAISTVSTPLLPPHVSMDSVPPSRVPDPRSSPSRCRAVEGAVTRPPTPGHVPASGAAHQDAGALVLSPYTPATPVSHAVKGSAPAPQKGEGVGVGEDVRVVDGVGAVLDVEVPVVLGVGVVEPVLGGVGVPVGDCDAPSDSVAEGDRLDVRDAVALALAVGEGGAYAQFTA